MNEDFDKLRDVNVRKTVHTAKRPVGILRHNAELMRDRGASLKDIEEYLWDNGADMNLIMAVPSPNEKQLARMVESEKSGKWAEQHQQGIEAKERAEASQEKLENLHSALNATRAFGNGLFLNYGDELESLLTGQNVDDIRADYGEWAARHPNWDLGLGIAGGIAPAFAGFGATGAAGKGLLGRTLIGAGTGLGMGGLAGFGAGTGGLENRLDHAGYGALFGGGIGAVAPLALGGVGRATGRIARGLGKGPTEQQIDNFILDNIVAGTGKASNQARRNASVLLQGIQDGDTALQDAAANLHNKTLVALGQNNPSITELALNPTWTPKTASTQQIMSAFTTPSKTAAMEEFGKFAAQQPEKTGAGLAVNNFFKNNPIAAKIVKVNKRRIGDDLTTYDGLQKIEQHLDYNLPKNLDTERATNRAAAILDAKDDLATLRETLFPGQSKVDAMYRASSTVQDQAQKKALGFLSQLSSGVTNPTNAEVSLTGAAKLGVRPYVRGRARELILKGALEPDATSLGERALDDLLFNSYRTLEQQK